MAFRAAGGGQHIGRIPIAAVAVFGLGGLVAIAAAVRTVREGRLAHVPELPPPICPSHGYD